MEQLEVMRLLAERKAADLTPTPSQTRIEPPLGTHWPTCATLRDVYNEAAGQHPSPVTAMVPAIGKRVLYCMQLVQPHDALLCAASLFH